ncbi:ryncolin-1-like [Zeugodacus cucurbitae]|uniref:ryncolin-1-like n=1 Tax=Zeugodacus cucurbitae TaxID=28588 RepID=UPI0023D8E601|nr:ryncolin-1-like [Zeugodacus cucurbitae]
MSRFVFFILVDFILILQIKFGFSQSNDTTTVRNCNCFVQIEAVNDDLDEVEQMSENKIDTNVSNIEKQLLENRASKFYSCMEAKPSSCMEAAAHSMTNGIFQITLEKINATALQVFCEEDVDFGGWLVIQRRKSDAVNFTRDWHDYKEGFGDLKENYWIGLEKLHALTSSCEQELYVQLEKYNGEKYYAKYSEFLIGDESESYALKKLGNYSGNAGDSLIHHLGKKFSTYDRDNDEWERSCAMDWKGGWWFFKCYFSHLNGLYGVRETGVDWIHITRNESLSFAQMMIRPTQNCRSRLMLNNLNRCL